MRELEHQSELDYQRKEGEKIARLKMAKKMKESGMPIGDIMLFTEMAEEEIAKL